MEFTTLTRRVAEATGTDAAEVAPAAVVIDTTDVHGPDVGAGAPRPETPAAEGSVASASAPVTNGKINTPAALAGARAQAVTGAKIDHKRYACIRHLADLQVWIAEARETGVVAFRTETTSLDPMRAEPVGFALSVRPGKSAYIPAGHRSSAEDLLGGGRADNQISVDEALAALKPLLTDRSVLKIGHNLKYDWLTMHRTGIDVGPFDDTMLISYVLGAGTGAHDIASLAERWLGHEMIPYKDVVGSGKSLIPFDLVDIERATTYATEGADIAMRLWHVLKPRLAADGLVSVYERLERPLVPVLARMEERGISVDRQMLSRLSGEFAQRAASLEEDVYQAAGERFTIGSPKQLGDILFGKMGLPGGAKTKSGQWSTTAQLLEELAAEGHELPRRIVDWRQLTKLKSTYTDCAARIHQSGHQAPAHLIRAGLDADRPHLVVRAEPAEHPDPHGGRTPHPHSLHRRPRQQAGLRRLQPDRAARARPHRRDPAAYAGVCRWRRHPCHDRVGNVRRACRGHALRRAPPRQGDQFRHHLRHLGLRPRQPARRSSAPRPATTSRSISSVFPASATIWTAASRWRATGAMSRRSSGAASTIREIRSSNPSIRAFNERASINAPIQGSAADIIRRAMIRMDDALAREKLSARMLLQVHDELIFEVAEEEVAATIPVVRAVMEGSAMPAVALKVPLHVDARAADNWDEAH